MIKYKTNLNCNLNKFHNWNITDGQCDARPTVISPAAGHHRPLTGTKLYCLVTEVHVCEQFAEGSYLKVERPRFEHATIWAASPTL